MSDAALRILENLGRQEYTGANYSLDRFRAVLERLGSPHLVQRKTIHVAGTNGKGSVATYAARMLAGAGLRTGLYLSPHLYRVNERISINGSVISDTTLARLIRHVRGVRGGSLLTYFELLTAVMFLWFAERRVEAAVIEVGLGGRLDATNVLPRTDVAVIASIGMDHAEILGRTIAQIAQEKAGIVKPGCRCVCGRLDRDAVAVVRAHCRAVGATARRIGVDFSVRNVRRTWERRTVRFDYRGATAFTNLPVRVLYRIQADNAALAIAAVESLGVRISARVVHAALNAPLPARFEFLSGAIARRLYPGIPIVVDGSHNPPAMRQLASLLRVSPWRRVAIATALMRQKDAEGVFRELFRAHHRIAVVIPYRLAGERARPARELARAAAQAGFAHACIVPADSPADALQILRGFCRQHRLDAVVWTGSLYAAREIRTVLERSSVCHG